MKKFLVIITLLLTVSVGMLARDYTTRDVNVLPQKARTFIKNTFNKKVNHIKVDKEMFGSTDYDVILSDGTEIDFDADGTWKSIDCGMSGVPTSVVPKAIATYVRNNFKGQKIVEIEVDKRGYEIQLGNGMELKFDRVGNFKSMDY